MSLNWFKKSTAEDERIVNLKNKLYKEVYTLIMIICDIRHHQIFCAPANGVRLAGNADHTGRKLIFRDTPALGIYSDEVEVHDQRSKISFSMRTAIWGLVIGFALALFRYPRRDSVWQ